MTFRFKAQQCNDQNLKVSHDLTKNLKSCTKLKYFYVHFQWQASPLCQREVNQNSQIDQSQARINVNRRQADQANAAPLVEFSMKNKKLEINHSTAF